MSLQQIEEIITKLSKQSMPYEWVMKAFSRVDELCFLDLDLETLELMGLKLSLNKDNTLSLATRSNLIKNETFCVVDIETTGGLKSGEIIEIGALKLQNGKEIERFESFVKVDFIPENITELTGISLDMVKDAPPKNKVLNDFRLFLKDSIFIAHNVKFDYNFISKALFECGFGVLLNRQICTIDFAKCCIESPRYKLETLKELLNITNTHHRALSDAFAASEIFKHCLSKLPFYISTSEDLIQFSKNERSKKSKKSHKP